MNLACEINGFNVKSTSNDGGKKYRPFDLDEVTTCDVKVKINLNRNYQRERLNAHSCYFENKSKLQKSYITF